MKRGVEQMAVACTNSSLASLQFAHFTFVRQCCWNTLSTHSQPYTTLQCACKGTCTTIL